MTPPTRWTPCWNGQNATGSTRTAQHRAGDRADRRAARNSDHIGGNAHLAPDQGRAGRSESGRPDGSSYTDVYLHGPCTGR
jgi:hypothetical protein